MLQDLVGGLLLGGFYALAALGFSLVWGVTGVANLAHGSFIMLGAYVAYYLFVFLHLDPFLAVPFSMAALFILGYAFGIVVLSRVLKHGVLISMIVCFGLDLLLSNLAQYIWSADYRGITLAYAGAGLTAGQLIVPYTRLGMFVVALALVGVTSWILDRTRWGQAIQAVSYNRDAARLVGIDPPQMYALTFGIGAALAGGAGALTAAVYSIFPLMGGRFLGRAFAVTVLGGMGSIPGGLLGGLLMGVAESLGVRLFGSGYQEGIGFAVMIATLVFRPRGLLGKRLSA